MMNDPYGQAGTAYPTACSHWVWSGRLSLMHYRLVISPIKKINSSDVIKPCCTVCPLFRPFTLYTVLCLEVLRLLYRYLIIIIVPSCYMYDSISVFFRYLETEENVNRQTRWRRSKQLRRNAEQSQDTLCIQPQVISYMGHSIKHA